MDKYEYRVKTEQMLEYMENKQYKKAMEIADTIDWRRVKNASMLNSVSEIYEYNGEYQKSRDILFVAYDRSPGSRKIVYRLGTLALKMNDTDEASDCYEEFVKLAPKDPNQYILKYKILRARRAPLAEQIRALEDFKKAEYVEKWAYELATLYDEAGMTAECLEECDDLVLWFSEGKYVYQAMELKMKYKPLTPLQQEKYDIRFEEEETVTEVVDVEEEEEEETVIPEQIPEEVPVLAEVEEVVEVPETEEEEEATALADATIRIDNVKDFMKEEEDDGRKVREESPIRKAVKGETLAEALANGMALANGLDIDEKINKKRDEELRIAGQMKIEDILAEWEEKQKVNAAAIKTQREKDEEKLDIQRREAEMRREAEARRIEEQQRAAEEARRLAEEARRLEEEREAEERRIAEEKAAEERRIAEEKAAEERRIAEEKAAEEALRIAEEQAAEQAKLDIDQDLLQLMEELEESDEEIDIDKELALVDAESDDEDEYEDDEYDEYDDEDEYEDDDEYDEYEDEDEYEDDDEYDEYDDEDEYEDDDEYDEYDDEYDEEDVDDLLESLEDNDDVVIEEPTEEEIQRRLQKGKGGVPFDTGFVVTGRYDLSATSEIGLKAGLTEEQKKLFSYFVPVRGMSEQIVEVLDNDRRERREGTSKTGNILVVGNKGTGKTVLAVDFVKAIQKQRNLRQGKVAIVTGESLNKKELSNIIQKLRGGAIIIEKAGKLNMRTVKELNRLMEKKTGELLFVLEDEKKPLEKLFTANPSFKKKFTSRLELPVFINDELVTFGQTYAKENGYKLDEMGILALYSRIDVLQREDHAVTVAEVKDIMDAAIEKSQKANVKHLARRVFGRSTDSSDRIILKEEDFRV